MPRPQKNRFVYQPPLYTEFRPVGFGQRFLQQVDMTIDEYEAIRLVDYQGLSHEQAAEEMGISRPTLTRLLDSARKKLSDMLVNGKRLVIAGGNVSFRVEIIRCLDCGHMFRIPYGEKMEKCPVCGSTNLLHLGMPPGGGFGRGPRWRGGRGHGRGRMT